MQIEFQHTDENFTSESVFRWKSKYEIDHSIELRNFPILNRTMIKGQHYITFDGGNQISITIALSRSEAIQLMDELKKVI